MTCEAEECPTDWIETVSGARFSLVAPSAADVRIGDIAHALAMQCRYAGHVRRFYSVAEHAVLLSSWVERETGDVRLAFAALHHDDAEAYLTDLPRPLKRLLPDYRALEERVDAAVAAAFGLPRPCPAIVRLADHRILLDERTQAMSGSGHDWGLGRREPLGVELLFLGPLSAADAFVRRHSWLTRQIARLDQDDPS